MSIDMSQFYQVFFEEASEHLANMETMLINLDVDDPSLEDLNAIFRAAHSIKGGSGTFGFNDMTEVTHVLESLLDLLRKQELALRAEMVDAFLAAGDVLRAQLEHHQGGAEVDRTSIDLVCARLDALASGEAAPAATVAPPPRPAAELRRLILDCILPAEVAGNADAVANIRGALEEIAAVEFLETPGATGTRLLAKLTTRHGDDEIREALSFYLSAGEIGLGPADTGSEAYGFFDDAAGAPACDPGYGFFEPEAVPSAVDPGYGFFADEPPAAVASSEGDVTVREEADADGGFGLFEDAPGKPEHLPNREVIASDSPAAVEGPGYGIFINAPGGVGMFDGAPSANRIKLVDTGQPEAPAVAPAQSPGRRLMDKPGVETVRAGRRDGDKVVTAAAATDTSIRVSVEKVDQIINLVGELVITQAMLAQAAGGLDPVEAERLLAGIDLLSRNTRDLQESVMSIRMLPMSMVFSRYPRVVRDLAGKLGKQVELKTIGEHTELDKGLIEKITDPMTHLVRNSLDHGIEMPDRRVAAGKSPKGTITLKASHQGGNIVIEVIDDGGGLNRERILAKAREKGMPVSDAMNDHEVWQLIMAPGFSTAEQVTDVSGRGVGMDVVKRNIEGLGGKVELESSPGFGTRIVIRLPLTLAILDGMSVGVGSETFIVPLTAVIESLQPRHDDIRTLAGDSRMVHIRGEYLPLVPLTEVFGLPGVEDYTRGIVVVVEAEEGKAALFVDQLLGQHQVVIKSLEANYRKVPGISGATIMGDGRVAMIIDVSAVTRMGLANSKRLKAA